MNPQPTEQSGRPRPPLGNQGGAVLRTTPARLLSIEEPALPKDGTPTQSSQPLVEHLTSAPVTRRISLVESVAAQIFSGTIKLGVSEQMAIGTGQGSPRRWPLMLNRAEVCEYLGASWRTLEKTLTVRPSDMGANIVRYNRDHLDSWAAGRPPMSPGTVSQDAAPVDQQPHGETPDAALARARDRGSKR